MAIDTATFETTLDSKIDAATTSDDAKSFLLLAKAVEAINNAISSSSLSKSNNLSDLLNTTTALTNLGFTATIAELNYTDGVTSNFQTQLDAKVEQQVQLLLEHLPHLQPQLVRIQRRLLQLHLCKVK